MEDLLNRLEKQIRDLVDQHSELKQSNQQLHYSKTKLVHEKDALMTKQQKAINQIALLLSKLKTLETVS